MQDRDNPADIRGDIGDDERVRGSLRENDSLFVEQGTQRFYLFGSDSVLQLHNVGLDFICLLHLCRVCEDVVKRHFHHHRLLKSGDEQRGISANECQVILREDGFDSFDDLVQRDVFEINQ